MAKKNKLKKLTNSDYKRIAYDLDLEFLWERIWESIEAYCKDWDLELPEDDQKAIEKAYDYLTRS